jgi:signal transduction histidine kinase
MGAAALAVLAVLRTIWPLRFEFGAPARSQGRAAVLLGTSAELALCLVVVGVTGAINSPFLISLGAAVFVSGLLAPPWALATVVVSAMAALAAAGVEGALSRADATRAVQRLAVLGAVAMLGSYSEWLLRAGRDSQGGEVERLRSLSEVNQLLLELHAKAASLPASLNLKVAVANTVSRLRGLLAPDVVVLFLSDTFADEDNDRWRVTLAEGVQLPEVLVTSQLAPALAEAMGSLGPVCRSALGLGEGVAVEASSGLYVPLWARGRLIGLLAVERVDPAKPFGNADIDIVAGVAMHAALAIDNARWFRRLRALGAEEERGRIARELHDRVGQSLAYVGLCLDRLASDAADGAGLSGDEAVTELEELAGEVRRATREVRTKLSDLRVEVAREGDLAEALAGLLARVEERSGIITVLSTESDGSLPPVLEREVELIAQEAINNAERHSGAGHIDVRWLCQNGGAELEVIDDGKGIPVSAPLRRDAFGILGMRERADSISASFAINSAAGRGTTVRLRIGSSKHDVR